jgi:hypothetical protein
MWLCLLIGEILVQLSELPKTGEFTGLGPVRERKGQVAVTINLAIIQDSC